MVHGPTSLGLVRALEMLRESDTVVVWKLDRLGRSVKQPADLFVERTRARLDVARWQCERLVRKLSSVLPLTYVWHFVASGDPMLCLVARDFERLR